MNRCLAFTSACSLRRTVPSRATGEGDVIVGPQHRSAIGTLVERHARYVKLLHLPRQDSVQLRDGLLRALAGLPTRSLPSITWDQGTEMARHLDITAATGAAVYFCDAGTPCSAFNVSSVVISPDTRRP